MPPTSLSSEFPSLVVQQRRRTGGFRKFSTAILARRVNTQ